MATKTPRTSPHNFPRLKASCFWGTHFPQGGEPDEGQGASCNTGSFRVFFLLQKWSLEDVDFWSKIFRSWGVFFEKNIGLGIEFWTSKMEFRTCFFEGFVNMSFLKDLFWEWNWHATNEDPNYCKLRRCILFCAHIFHDGGVWIKLHPAWRTVIRIRWAEEIPKSSRVLPEHFDSPILSNLLFQPYLVVIFPWFFLLAFCISKPVEF